MRWSIVPTSILGVWRLTAAVTVLLLPAVGRAGPDDDAPFRSDGVTRNAVDPIIGGGLLADYPTNAEPVSGLRILPPTDTQLLPGQRFDLRIETQIPAAATPQLGRLRVNGLDVTAAFRARLRAQGTGLESGTPASPRLYGATVRNLSFTIPGRYTVEATLNVDGIERSVRNSYAVAALPAVRRGQHLVFFLGDAMGLPVRTAARVVGRGIFEGRTRGALRMDDMQEIGLVHTASFDSTITDSAPGMASYVTGMKQANNALNVSVDNTPDVPLDNPRIETLWEFLKRTRGWRTGVVTDAFATDATPAAVAVHTRSRITRAAIAQQMLDVYRDGTAQPLTGFAALQALTQPLDVIIGAGPVDWTLRSNATLSTFYQYPAGAGRTDIDLFADVAPSLGYSVARNADELRAAPNDKPLLALFSGEFRPTASGLGPDNVPAVLDRLVAHGRATIRGRDASAPELGLAAAPPFGSGCGASVAECFRAVPSKTAMVQKAVAVLDRLAGRDGSWALLVEQSQIDKLAHALEYERVVYEALELDNALGWVLDHVATDGRTLVLVTADHAQPESIVGVVLPNAIASDGATPAGGCFAGAAYPLALGIAAETLRPCVLQDVRGTNDATFPTYRDADGDGYPDDPDPLVKLVLKGAGRPIYSQDFLTNFQPLTPASRSSAALPEPRRDPAGLLMTGNMPTRVVAGSANKTEGNVIAAPHSGDDVPLSASGRGAELFGGVYENADVTARIALALAGAERRPRRQPGSTFAVPATAPRHGLAGLCRGKGSNAEPQRTLCTQS
ncbi:MAG: alkaline phosphatase [bacterium]